MVPPETTYERIQPYLEGYGITRLADVTGLDRLGLPVYVATRPRGRLTQFSQGKGLRAIDAKVSALMEAIESFHFENPIVEFSCASIASLERAGRAPIPPPMLCEFASGETWSQTRKTLWVEGEDLISGRGCMVPASSVYAISPRVFNMSSNGLASGNNELEATLHGLLEVYERDALSGLLDGDGFSFDGCDTIDVSTAEASILGDYFERFSDDDVALRLFRVSIESVVHTFMAVLVEQRPLAPSSRVNCGFGSHLSPSIAASRAMTEAAQTRIANIHGAREFLTMDMFRDWHDHFVELVMSYEPDMSWAALDDVSTPTLSGDLELVLAQFQHEGSSLIVRHTLTPPQHEIAVVKVQVPGARDDLPL